VECILRAYFFRKHGKDAKLEAAHDIFRLFRASGLKAGSLEARSNRRESEREMSQFDKRIQAGIGVVDQIWTNDLRYDSESRLGADLRRRNLHRGVRGDYLKFHAQRPVQAARRVVDEGVESWSHSKKK
jgi:hypothetical protein